ncbi:hypothetical protein FQA39_LY05415 [Lamprigera yunnana]|nr:hypothetical protein FQA39_LY05415 [Lamprigera yunnana]
MVLKLYTDDLSPVVQAVLLTARALDLKLEKIFVNHITRETRKPEFIQINPQHCVPTLDDDGVIIWDSHAINAYLVIKYGKDDSLYPSDPIRRAIVDQRLHFDSCNLFGILRLIYRLIRVRNKDETILQFLIDQMNESLEILNRFLKNSKWAASDDLTIADFSLISTITFIDILIPIDLKKYANIDKWMNRVKHLPYYDAHQKGLKDFQEHVNELLHK